ncbi:MAG TPA: AAA family ATPase, partial [Ilumatobacteraceae bacterium]|nr:AAA family ATPase [Ilumatobacteraceae bacterium]
MQALFALVDAARRGDGGIATLIGPAGSGKTRLLDELVEHAQWRGPGHDVALTIRRGRVPVLGTDTPFAAPLAAFSLGLGRFGTATAAPRSLIEASVGDRASAAGVVEQLLSLVDSEVAAGPLLLVLDDLHEADIGTVSFVEQLVPRLASIPVALVLASRPTRSGPFRRWLDQGASLVIQLQPLTSDDVAEMARLFLGGHPGPRLRHVLDAAGPLPLFATAILESIHPPDLSGGPDATVDLAEAAAAQLLAQAPRAVASRLEELRDETRQPLLAAAVLGDTFAASRVMAMLGTTLSQTIDALERAEHAGLLITEGNTYRFRHDLYRDAVLASASK